MRFLIEDAAHSPLTKLLQPVQGADEFIGSGGAGNLLELCGEYKPDVAVPDLPLGNRNCRREYSKWAVPILNCPHIVPLFPALSRFLRQNRLKGEKAMYKITHYDYNCSPICDGTVSFFTEDIEAFQKKWFAMDRLEESLKEKFLRSKGGELVTDWYSSDDPELNIVQQGQSAVYGEKQ